MKISRESWFSGSGAWSATKMLSTPMDLELFQMQVINGLREWINYFSRGGGDAFSVFQGGTSPHIPPLMQSKILSFQNNNTLFLRTLISLKYKLANSTTLHSITLYERQSITLQIFFFMLSVQIKVTPYTY